MATNSDSSNLIHNMPDVESFSLQPLVLVVDDEPSICWAFEKMLQQEGCRVISASSAEAGLDLARAQKPCLILLDVRLPQQDGITALPAFREATNGAPIVLMTAFGDLETALAAVREGASDYLIKPFSLEQAQRVCQRALERESTRSKQTVSMPSRDCPQRLMGQSPAMQHAYRQIALVANSDLSVLITGETGTGKELVAAAIQQHSPRKNAPYIPISPAALSPELIESELFGHVQGAFTGAHANRAGLFERAEGGTILLDEIADLPLGAQVKLLRVLEQREYSPVGDITPRRCDVRILAATNSDLILAMHEGRFREDLLYRLNGLHIHLPPLRDRLEDLGPLCEYFLRCLQYQSDALAIDSQLLEQLAGRPWYGNVRELRNAVEHAVVFARGRKLSIHDFPPAQQRRSKTETVPLASAINSWVRTALERNEYPNGLMHELMNEVEPKILLAVLQSTDGNRVKASEILGIHRGTLREKIRLYNLADQFPRSMDAPE